MSDRQLHRVQILCPEGVPWSAKVLLDGEEVHGVTRVGCELVADRPAKVTFTMIVESLEADGFKLTERVFENPKPDEAL